VIVTQPCFELSELPGARPGGSAQTFEQTDVIPMILHPSAPGVKEHVFRRAFDFVHRLPGPAVSPGYTVLHFPTATDSSEETGCGRGAQPQVLCHVLQQTAWMKMSDGAPLLGLQSFLYNDERGAGQDVGVAIAE